MDELKQYYCETLENIAYLTQYTGERNACLEGIKAIKAIEKIQTLIKEDSHEVYNSSGLPYNVIEVSKLKEVLS